MKLQVLKNGNRVEVDQVDNVFCPTGQGGGVDPTCKRGGKGGRGGSGRKGGKGAGKIKSTGGGKALSIETDQYGTPTKSPKGYRKDREHPVAGYLHKSNQATAVKKLKSNGFTEKLSSTQYRDKEGRVGIVTKSSQGVSIFVVRPTSSKASGKDPANSIGDRAGRTVDR